MRLSIFSQSLTGASFVAVQVLYTVRDHATKANRTLSKTIFNPANGSAPLVSPLNEQPNIVATAYSPSRSYFAVLREDGEGDSAKRFVEIWQKDHLVLAQEVTKLHGQFYTDGTNHLLLQV